MIKINRTKLVPNLMTLATIGIVLLLFSTSVQATTTIRPIEDYPGDNLLAWSDPDSGLAIHPHAVVWFDPLDVPDPLPMHWNVFFFQYKNLEDCPHGGFIQERVINESHTLITIHLHVKEVPFMLFNLYVSGDYPLWWMYEPIYKGIMQYYFQCRILFNTAYLYDILENEIPSPFEIAFYCPEPVPVITYYHMIGEGYLTEGGEGTVIVNQVGILDPDIGDYVWPVEMVIIE